MSDQPKQYRTVVGIVQFEPRDSEAGGKPVRNVRIRQVGIKEQSIPVNATVWPSHKHIALAEGDVVMMEGTFNVRKVNDDETGQTKTFYNLSVSKLAVLGKADGGKKVEVANSGDGDEPAEDDDIPF